MSWEAVIISGAAAGAAGSIYQGNAVAAGNELKKKQLDTNYKQGQLDAAATQFELAERLNTINATNIGMAGSQIGQNMSLSAVLNKNAERTDRAINLSQINQRIKQVNLDLSKRGLDFASKTSKTAGHLNALNIMGSSTINYSMLGGPSNGTDGGAK